MSIDMNLLYQIVSVLLLVVSVLFGGYLLKFKKKLSDATDLMVSLNKALEDNAISDAEWIDMFNKLGVLLHDCPADEPPSERKRQIYLIIAIACVAVFIVWYFFVHGW